MRAQEQHLGHYEPKSEVAQSAVQPSQSDDIRARDAQSEEEWYYSVGIQNYVFALPLSILERERKVRLNPVALEKAKKFAPAAPINQIGHMKPLGDGRRCHALHTQ